MAPLLVGTDEGLHRLDASGPAPVQLEDRRVHALAPDGEGWWALVDGTELWRSSEAGDWRLAVTFAEGRLNCVLGARSGVLAGADRARLFHLQEGDLAEVMAFQRTEGRGEWYTPWGGPPDVRSLSQDSDGTIYANVHVGGIVRSRDGGSTWEPTLDIDADVHQVLAPADPGMVLAASAWGLGESTDGGETWAFEDEGLHGSYLRSVAVTPEGLFVGASEGHMGRRSAVYRRPKDHRSFVRCASGLPGWFGSNIDTFCLVARHGEVAFGTEEGAVFRSDDAGVSWSQVAAGLPSVRCLTFT